MANGALAQTADNTAARGTAAESGASAPGPQLEEIIVTARRREENLQQTPISVTALGAETLKEKGFNSLSDIAGAAPNVQFPGGNAAGGSSAQVFIRGVGQSDYLLTTDPGVGIYIDGVYIARQTGTPSNLTDFQRVEVLRGPQGTLFGKNTLGGALNIVTQEPDGQLAGNGRVQFGSRDRHDFDGSIRFPISEQLAGSMSVSVQRQNGYYHNFTTGQDFSDVNRDAARGKLRWTPTEALTLTLTGDFERKDQNGPGSTDTVILPATTPNFLGSIPLLNTATPPTNPVSTQYAGLWNAAVGGCPPANSVSRACMGPQWDASGYHTNETQQQSERGQNWGTSLTTTYRLEPFTLKSITAYRKFWTYFDAANDGTPLPIASIPSLDHQHQLSEELQLTGSAMEERLKWTGGLYYFKENSQAIADVHFLEGVPQVFPLSGLDDGTGNPVIQGPPGSGAPPVLVPTQALFTALNLHTVRQQTGTSYAGYGQGTFNFTQRLSATFGARFSIEKKAFTFTQVDLNGPPAIAGVMDIAPTSRDKSWSSFTPRYGLEFQLTPEELLYLSAARGFKSGGFNARPTSSPPRFTSYDPEYLWTYEAGYKSEWLDRRLRVNADVFYSKYSNIQLQTFIFSNGEYITEVANAGNGHMKGMEAEITAVPHPRLTLSAAVGLLDFGYDTVHDVVGPNTNTPPGRRLPYTPKWSANASARVIVWKAVYGDAAFRADYRYQSQTTFDVFNQGLEGGYGVLDARLSFFSANGKWEVFALGRNLTDKLYGSVGNFNLMGIAQVWTYAPPREWGAGFRYNF